MAQTNVQAFSGDVEISGDTVLGTATYRKKRRWDRNVLAYVYLGNIKTNNTTGIRLDVSLNNSNTGYQMYQFQITLQGEDVDHSGRKLVYSVQGTKNSSVLKSIEIGYVYVGSGGSHEYQLWLKDPTTDVTGNMDAYLNCQNYYNFDTGISDVAQGGAAPTNFNLGVVGLLVDSTGNVGIGTTSPDNVLHIRNAIPTVLLDDSDDDTKVRITGGAGGDLYVDSNWGGSGNTGDIIFREASSEKMRITGSGNVGIGTDDPDTQLEIKNGASGTLIGLGEHHLKLSTSNALAYSTDDVGPGIVFTQRYWNASAVDRPTGAIYGVKTTANGSNGGGLTFAYQNSSQELTRSITMNHEGNVGIGTTLFDITNPVISGAGNGLYIHNAVEGGHLLTLGTQRPWVFEQGLADASTELNLRSLNSGKKFSIQSPDHSNVMTIVATNGGGAVGIGTTNPDCLLHLSSATGSSSIVPTKLKIHTTTEASDWSITDPWGLIEFDINDPSFAGSGPVAGIGVRSGDTTGGYPQLCFYTDNNESNDTALGSANERMVIDHNGDVGIGTTNPVGVNGGRRLEGSSSTGFEYIATRDDDDILDGEFIGAYLFKNDDNGGAEPHYAGMSAKTIGEGGKMALHFHTNRDQYESDALPAMIIDHNNKVGIGTADPGTKLHVEHYGSAIGDFEGIRIANHATNLHATTRPAYEFVVSDIDAGTGIGASKFAIGYRDTTSASRTDRLVIDASGNVGIRTTNPACRFDVANNSDTLYLARFINTSTSNDQDARVMIQASDAGGEVQLLFQTTNQTTTHAWNVASGSGLTPSFQVQYDVTADYNGGTMAFEIPHGGGARITGTEGSGDYNDTNYGYTAAGLDANPNQQSFGLDVKSGSIRSNGGLVAYSDTRIKSNIVDINDTYALDQIRAIQPRYYEYVDKHRRGSSSVIGFIAQEVKEVIPRAVSVANGRIPNIYSFANINASNVLTFTDFNTSTLDSNATTEIEVFINGKNAKSVTISEIIDEHNIRVVEDISEWGCTFDENGNVVSEIVNTTLTLDEYKAHPDKGQYSPNISGYEGANVIISVDEYNSLEDKTGYTEVVESYNKTSIMYPGNQIFVWGQGVTDFHHINKDYIWTVATAALQEVDRQLQVEKARNDALEARITALENA